MVLVLLAPLDAAAQGQSGFGRQVDAASLSPTEQRRAAWRRTVCSEAPSLEEVGFGLRRAPSGSLSPALVDRPGRVPGETFEDQPSGWQGPVRDGAPALTAPEIWRAYLCAEDHGFQAGPVRAGRPGAPFATQAVNAGGDGAAAPRSRRGGFGGGSGLGGLSGGGSGSGPAGFAATPASAPPGPAGPSSDPAPGSEPEAPRLAVGVLPEEETPDEYPGPPDQPNPVTGPEPAASPTPVPLPAAFTLLLAALGTLLSARVRRAGLWSR